MASKRRVRQKACQRKKGYLTEQAAERACLNTATVDRNRGFCSDVICRLLPYRCSHCGMWHIGHERQDGQAWKNGRV